MSLLNYLSQVSLRDLRTFKMEHEFDAFSGSLSDFDVHGNLLAACGFSSRGLNGLSCDRFLMVYDLRMMRAITPLQVHVDPLFLRFIPTYTSRLAIISQTGMMHVRVCLRSGSTGIYLTINTKKVIINVMVMLLVWLPHPSQLPTVPDLLKKCSGIFICNFQMNLIYL